jgi:SpoVK/Ycf46/Vps4 family AAA+-type ATPase
MISYPLPDLKQITKFYKIELADLLKKKKLPVDEMVKESLGLSYADIDKVCQDFL